MKSVRKLWNEWLESVQVMQRIQFDAPWRVRNGRP